MLAYNFIFGRLGPPLKSLTGVKMLANYDQSIHDINSESFLCCACSLIQLMNRSRNVSYEMKFVVFTSEYDGF